MVCQHPDHLVGRQMAHLEHASRKRLEHLPLRPLKLARGIPAVPALPVVPVLHKPRRPYHVEAPSPPLRAQNLPHIMLVLPYLHDRRGIQATPPAEVEYHVPPEPHLEPARLVDIAPFETARSLVGCVDPPPDPRILKDAPCPERIPSTVAVRNVPGHANILQF